MATTTTNYAFDVPTSSDLVKNGATAIAELGQDIDTFLFRPFTKNGVINGAMDIWQRGTSIAQTAGANYTADRWQQNGNGTPSFTVSRQLTNDTTNLPFIQYSARVQRTASSINTSANGICQSIETANSIPFAGKTVTLSFYARAGANYSSALSVLNTRLVSNSSADQNILINGGTNVFDTAVTLTTTWQRFSITGSMPSNTQSIGIFPTYTPVGTAGANDWFEITGIQLEAGNKSSPFTRAGETIQGELSACQRYYERVSGGSVLGSGRYFAATQADVFVPYKVTKRATPTFGSAAAANFNSSSVAALTAITTNGIYVDALVVRFTHTGTNSTTGFAALLTGNVNAYIEVIAEL